MYICLGVGQNLKEKENKQKIYKSFETDASGGDGSISFQLTTKSHFVPQSVVADSLIFFSHELHTSGGGGGGGCRHFIH